MSQDMLEQHGHSSENQFVSAQKNSIESLPIHIFNHINLISDALITSGIAALIVVLIHTELNFRSLMVVIGIALGYGLGFAVNDYFDVPYDKLQEDKASQNYFVQNKPTIITKILLVLTLILMTIIFSLFGFLGIVILIFSIIVMLSYSAEPIRFKRRAGFDIIIHAFFVEVYPYILPILLLRLNLLPIDYVIIPILLLNSAINQLEQQKRDYSVDKLTHETFVVKFGKRISSYVIKFLNLGIFIFLGIGIFKAVIPLIIIPQVIIAFPLTFHRFFVGPEQDRSPLLYKISLYATIIYWVGVLGYILIF